MPSYGLRREHDKPSRANDAAVLASRLSKCCGGFAVCRPAHAHRFCSRVGSRYIMHCALHTLVLMGPPWCLGAAVANFVAARALGDHTKPYACDGVRHARKLKAARTDAAGRKCGEMTAAGDWCRGVHRELPGINAAAGQNGLPADMPSSEKGGIEPIRRGPPRRYPPFLSLSLDANVLRESPQPTGPHRSVRSVHSLPTPSDVNVYHTSTIE